MYRVELCICKSTPFSDNIVRASYFISAETKEEAAEKLKNKFSPDYFKKFLNMFDDSLEKIILNQIDDIDRNSIDRLSKICQCYIGDSIENVISKLIDGIRVVDAYVEFKEITDGTISIEQDDY